MMLSHANVSRAMACFEHSNFFKVTASSKIFDLLLSINEFERTISFEPLIEPITSLVPILHFLELIASLIVFSRFFIFILHTHVKFDHARTDRYGSAYYNVFCYAFKGLYLSFQRSFCNCWYSNFKRGTRQH